MISHMCLLRSLKPAFFGWVVLNLTLTSLTRAETPEPSRASEVSVRPKLSGPPLNPAPADSQWIISYTYPQERKEFAKPDRHTIINSDLPRRVVTTKTGSLIHEEIWAVSGKKQDCWQLNGNYYIKFPGKNFWSAYEKDPANSQPAAQEPALPASGFRGLDWVNEQTYLGLLKSDQSSYLIFVPTKASGANIKDSSSLQKQPFIAYIDAQSRLPANVIEENVIRSYKFTTAPAALALPPELAAEIKQGDAIRAKRNAAPAREF